ncbi:MAG: tetratricopeptide repeat protein [Methylobacter sp.]
MTIPPKLIDSLAKGQVIPFIGAGVSMSVINKADNKPLFPSWPTLLMQAVKNLETAEKNDDVGIVRGLINKKRFLEAAQEAKQALGAGNWCDLLKQQFDRKKEDARPESLKLAEQIWELGSHLVITTNYDKVLRWTCPEIHDLAEWDIGAPAEQHDLLRNGSTKPTVWHLHGHIDNAVNIILAPDGYQKLYGDNGEGQYKAALQTLQHQLASRTFLFIGFSLADQDFVGQLKLIEEIFQGISGPHYVLLPKAARDGFTPPTGSIEALFFDDFGAPMETLLNELAGHAKPAIAKATVSSGEVGDFSSGKPAFNVPFASKGEQMIGRQQALEDVHRQLCSGKRTAIGQTASFQGLGGLGKTQLAVEYAHAYRDEYPNGVIWITVDQDISVQLIKLAESSRWVSPHSEQSFKLDTAIKRLHDYSDCLIIFDNLDNQQAIAEFLPSPTTKVHILVTSRRDQPGFTPIPLSTLSSELGLQLLLQEAGREPQDQAEQLAANAIVTRLDGLPLALELAGAYLRRRTTVSWGQYLELLQDNLQAAFPVSLSGESFTRHEADIHSTLKIQEALFAEEPLLKDLLDVLTWSGPAPMSVSLLCALLNLDKTSSLTNALALGCALRILQKPDASERYAIHRLVGEVRRTDIPLAERRDWVELCGQRLGDWFQARRRDFNDLPMFEAELDHLQAWLQNAETSGLLLQAARFTWLQAYPAYHWGRYHEAKQGIEQARELYELSPVPDAELNAHLLSDLGSVIEALGNAEAALKLGEAALAIRKELFGEQHPDTADSLNNVAGYYYALGNAQRALELGEQALEIRRKLFGEQHPDTANSLSNVAGYYNVLGNTQRALELGEQALEIRRKLFGGQHPDTANSLNNVASYYHALGNTQRALEFGELAWAIRQKLFGDTHADTVLSNHNVISYLANSGKRTEAFERLERQLAVLKHDHPHYERLQKLRKTLLQKPLRPGFRQPPSKPGKNKSKKRG